MSIASDFVIENGILKQYVGPGGDVIVPEGVTGIGKRAFYNCRPLTGVTIPVGVTSIGSEAFSLCVNMKKAKIPRSVTSIGHHAFDNCTRLKAVTIPEGLTTIEDKTFGGCTSLASITIPQSVTCIGSGAFSYCRQLASLTIPGTVKTIGDEAFTNCDSLKEVRISNGVVSIGAGAFHNCKALKELFIPESVEILSNGIVSDCKALEHLSMTEKQFLSKAPLFLLSRWERREFAITHVYSMGDSLSFLLHVRRGQEESWLAFANRADASNLKGYGSPGFWERYDRELLNSGVIYSFKSPVRLLGALARLMRPDDLYECDRQAYTEYLAQNTKRLISLLKNVPSPDGIRALFSLGIIREENRAEALKQISSVSDPKISAIAKEDLGPASTGQEIKQVKEPSPVEAVYARIRNASGQIDGSTDRTLKEYYTLSIDYLPVPVDRDGRQASKEVLAWLLTAHESVLKGYTGSVHVVPAYSQPGLCPEAAEIVSMLDAASLQSALKQLADSFLVYGQSTKKKFLAYPFCRYANEANMAELTKRAPGWRSSVSGDDAPPLRQLRDAVKYSNTRAAMLFAERYGELDAYAALRGVTEDELRDKYLSDVGLDEKGGKAYDLGNQTVTARLQKDLSFLFELPGGKTAKSLPKRNADPVRFEAAKADYDEMRKAVKKIVKSRAERLFRDFLNGSGRAAADWQEAYLKNPLLRSVAELVVWEQNGKTFVLAEGKLADSEGQPYAITDGPIRVAHPMEMDAKEVRAWQRYFTGRGLKQPFLQVWEPVIDPGTIQEDRYAGSVQPMYRFSGRDRHGIHSGALHAYSTDIGFTLDGCELEYKASTWRINYNGAEEATYTLGMFSFQDYTRQVNHIVALLDQWTAADRVRKDDLSVMELMDRFTLAQITEFIAAAQEANANNVLAALLDYKNTHCADFDPMAEFTLEW